MSASNLDYVTAVSDFENGLAKPAYSVDLAAKGEFFLNAYADLTGKKVTKHQLIVDFGCGGGATTQWFESAGYNVHGVDILEYWGRDANLLGERGAVLAEETLARLHVVSPISNRLPFDDSSIDLLISDQTLEHVFDHRSIFVEQARVLKPGAIAIHRFPQRLCWIEPHTKVPITPLNRFTAYLAIWAFLGHRNERNKDMNWREALRSNKMLFATTNYVSRKFIVATAEGLGMRASLIDLLHLSNGRAAKLYRAAKKFRVDFGVCAVVSLLQDNLILVLRKV
jgi:SAM-dependent methyltransferase